MGQVRHVIVTVDDRDLPAIAKVADSLKRKGLKNLTVMDAIGIIAGDADAEVIDALRAVRGVAGIEEEGTFQLPPPDAPIQ